MKIEDNGKDIEFICILTGYSYVCMGYVIAIRDNNKDLNYDDPNIPTQTGEFGINIHRSNPRGTSKNVNNWSAGCQVFANSEDFKVFMELCTKSYKQQNIKKGKIRFTYTLIEA